VPGFIFESKAAVIIPYYSIFGPASIFKSLGLPIFEQVTENMFIAPITYLGWFLIILFWFVVYVIIGFLINLIIRK
jgi:hypothetical protein